MKGLRPHVLEQLREINRAMRVMVGRWSFTPSVRWYDAGDGRGLDYQKVARSKSDIPKAEYPEHNPDQLKTLDNYMSYVISIASQIRQDIKTRLDELDGSAP